MMRKILTRVGIGVGAATVLVVAVGFLLPRTFEVSKTMVIKAKPARIHEFTGDLARWNQWAPWLKDDPTLVVTPGEKTTGAGASQTWSGKSSDGHLAFTRSDPTWGISYNMAFGKSTYEATGSLLYRKVPEGTEVVWSMTGDNGRNIMARYFGFLMPSMIGPMFDEGLARLKLISERADSTASAVPES